MYECKTAVSASLAVIVRLLRNLNTVDKASTLLRTSCEGAIDVWDKTGLIGASHHNLDWGWAMYQMQPWVRLNVTCLRFLVVWVSSVVPIPRSEHQHRVTSVYLYLTKLRYLLHSTIYVPLSRQILAVTRQSCVSLSSFRGSLFNAIDCCNWVFKTVKTFPELLSWSLFSAAYSQ